MTLSMVLKQHSLESASLSVLPSSVGFLLGSCYMRAHYRSSFPLQWDIGSVPAEMSTLYCSVIFIAICISPYLFAKKCFIACLFFSETSLQGMFCLQAMQMTSLCLYTNVHADTINGEKQSAKLKLNMSIYIIKFTLFFTFEDSSCILFSVIICPEQHE